MNARRGQVAVYLVLALLALVVLALMNVNVFLAVRAKNRAMNAADAAAIAAARWQGALLNRMARMNVEHLQALTDARIDEAQPWQREMEQRDLAMFRPLEAIAMAGDAAESWGAAGGDGEDALKPFKDHLEEIRTVYAENPELYPEYREGQWKEYADQLANSLVAGGNVVLPAYMETASAWQHDPLVNHSFYQAIAAKAWCWFRFGSRQRYLGFDHGSMPNPQVAEPAPQENSEVFSLHVRFDSWPTSSELEFDERWAALIARLAERPLERVRAAKARILDPNEQWAFYDEQWGKWSTSFNPSKFPMAGEVREEYDVAGCAASVRIAASIPELLSSDDMASHSLHVTAEAKPLGTVTVDGEVRPVTAFDNLILPSEPNGKVFTEAQLVPMGSVPRTAGYSTEPQWYEHVREHLADYLASGPKANGCGYCARLVWWESAANRESVRSWLGAHGDTCVVSGAGSLSGGGWNAAH